MLYRDTVEKLVKGSSFNTNTESITLLGLEMRKIETILLHATETAIEGHHTHGRTIKPRGKGKWNSEIAKASQLSKIYTGR